MIYASVNTASMNAMISSLVKRAKERVPKAVATEGKKVIIDNAAQGKDIQGRRMVKYTKPYARKRQQLGKKTNPVDLRVTGHLLDEQKITVNGNRSSIEPHSADSIKAEGIMQKREFYPRSEQSISDKFIKRIVKAGEGVMSDG